MCVVKGPAQGAMAKSKKEKSRSKKALLAMEEGKTKAQSESTPTRIKSINGGTRIKSINGDPRIKNS